jgi:hypothetical protein
LSSEDILILFDRGNERAGLEKINRWERETPRMRMAQGPNWSQMRPKIIVEL